MAQTRTRAGKYVLNMHDIRDEIDLSTTGIYTRLAAAERDNLELRLRLGLAGSGYGNASFIEWFTNRDNDGYSETAYNKPAEYMCNNDA